MPTKEPFRGRYLYRIQGTMQGQSVENGLYEPARPLTTGLADERRDDPVKEAPLLGAFRTHHEGKDPLPFYRTKAGVPVDSSFEELRFQEPAQSVPAFKAVTGLYPFAEMGYVILGKNGASSLAWLNVGGCCVAEHQNFVGDWRLEDDLRVDIGQPPGKETLPAGVITLKMVRPNGTVILEEDGKTPKFVWDYRFGFTSPTEAIIMTAGRRVRPAVASGRMWRVGDA